MRAEACGLFTARPLDLGHVYPAHELQRGTNPKKREQGRLAAGELDHGAPSSLSIESPGSE